VISAIAEIPYPLGICECLVPKASKGHHAEVEKPIITIESYVGKRVRFHSLRHKSLCFSMSGYRRIHERLFCP
jgi:hypothetical protein